MMRSAVAGAESLAMGFSRHRRVLQRAAMAFLVVAGIAASSFLCVPQAFAPELADIPPASDAVHAMRRG